MGKQELEPDWRGYAAMTTPGEQIRYIVDNGFDLHHGIPSSYAAFGRYLKPALAFNFPKQPSIWSFSKKQSPIKKK